MELGNKIQKEIEIAGIKPRAAGLQKYIYNFMRHLVDDVIGSDEARFDQIRKKIIIDYPKVHILDKSKGFIILDGKIYNLSFGSRNDVLLKERIYIGSMPTKYANISSQGNDVYKITLTNGSLIICKYAKGRFEKIDDENLVK